MPYTFSFLGSYNVCVNGEPVTGFRSNKARALLAYLAVESDRPHLRTRLAALLWPDSTDENARANLRHALSNLGKLLERGTDKRCLLIITRTSAQFNRARDCHLDVADLESALPPPGMEPTLLSSAQMVQMHSAVAGYRGQFLEGFSLEQCNEFEIWRQQTQARLHRAVQQVIRCLIECDKAQGKSAQALHNARHWLALEPTAEEAHRQVMKLLYCNGERSAALAQFEACRHILAMELNVPPSPETVTLYESIKRCHGLMRAD